MRVFYVILLCFGLSIHAFSQIPNWSVDPSAYQHNMNLVAVLNVEAKESKDSLNLLAAFVNDECRGIAKLKYFPTVNRYLAFLTIYSNSNGDTLKFKVFDSKTNKVYNSPNDTLFRSNQTFGEISKPYVIYTTNPPESISISNDSIDENLPINTKVGDFFTFVKDTSLVFTYSLVSGQGDDHNDTFYLIGSNLMTRQGLDFEGIGKYKIRLRASHSQSGVIEQDFVIKTIDVPEPAYDIVLSKYSIPENNDLNAFVAKVSVLDQDTNSVHTLALTASSVLNNNKDFELRSDSLFIKVTANFEKDKIYEIELEAVDQGGLKFKKKLNILIEDVNEEPKITSDTIYVKEFALDGSDVATISIDDPDLGQTHDFSILDTDQSTFSVDASTGDLTVLDNALLDYDKTRKINLPIEVKDDGSPELSQQRVLKILVEDVPDGQLQADNFFSPNGDGFNDTWTIENVGLYHDYELTIFNSNGNKVYSTRSYKNDWDGKQNGKDLPEGVYYYLLKGRFTYRGFIMLVRK